MNMMACNANALCSTSVLHLDYNLLYEGFLEPNKLKFYSVVCQASTELGMSPQYQKNGMAKKSWKSFRPWTTAKITIVN
jgi:hypothetical protein